MGGSKRCLKHGIGRLHGLMGWCDAAKVSGVQRRVQTALERRVHDLKSQNILGLGEDCVLRGRDLGRSESSYVRGHLIVAQELASHALCGRRLFGLLARLLARQAKFDHFFELQVDMGKG